jgi:hypothetical protein
MPKTDPIAALTELVRLKDIADTFDGHPAQLHGGKIRPSGYKEEKAAAWAAARDILNNPPEPFYSIEEILFYARSIESNGNIASPAAVRKALDKARADGTLDSEGIKAFYRVMGGASP